LKEVCHLKTQDVPLEIEEGLTRDHQDAIGKTAETEADTLIADIVKDVDEAVAHLTREGR